MAIAMNGGITTEILTSGMAATTGTGPIRARVDIMLKIITAATNAIGSADFLAMIEFIAGETVSIIAAGLTARLA